MAAVNNATGVYATLGYNFSDPNHNILPLSSDTLAHMNTVPTIIKSWQAQDIANNSVSGYYKNPAANVTSIISNTANSIVLYTTGLTSTDPATNVLWQQISTTPLKAESRAFFEHTNRISGVSDYNTDIQNGSSNYNKPYLQTAMASGKAALYIVNQTDNIQNTSPILGSFTSILVVPQIYDQSNVIITYPNVIANSITTTTDANGNTINISSLSYSQVLSINNDIANTTLILNTRRVSDENFYINLQTFNKNYNNTTQFNNMGETQSYLVNNFIGTPKLLSRINS